MEDKSTPGFVIAINLIAIALIVMFKVGNFEKNWLTFILIIMGVGAVLMLLLKIRIFSILITSGFAIVDGIFIGEALIMLIDHFFMSDTVLKLSGYIPAHIVLCGIFSLIMVPIVAQGFFDMEISDDDSETFFESHKKIRRKDRPMSWDKFRKMRKKELKASNNWNELTEGLMRSEYYRYIEEKRKELGFKN